VFPSSQEIEEMIGDEDSTRELAVLKAYLEKHLKELKEEVDRISLILRLVNSALADRSFKRMQVPSFAKPLEPTSGIVSKIQRDVVPVTTQKGIHLADIEVLDRELILRPSEGMNFDVDSPPFKTFLIGRVLDSMVMKDHKSKQLEPRDSANGLSYTLEKDNNNLRKLVIKNYGDQKRLQELRNSIRWTLRRLYEKTGTA
jgi:hypothetical protein